MLYFPIHYKEICIKHLAYLFVSRDMYLFLDNSKHYELIQLL